ncbi:hypothetical protein CDAR_164081 [Caerostris darwini]|uniref:Uncharacterized protein n=1 Tax=Caerostris darwini TaxID=1538125 RepID=A0AAV4U9H6_9ARAC|nr:hypothetical protein CDAR_164081 [Caerostris darwini]
MILLLQLSSRQNNRTNLIYSIKMALNQNLEVNSSQLAIRPPDLKKIKLRLTCLHSGVVPRNSAKQTGARSPQLTCIDFQGMNGKIERRGIDEGGGKRRTPCLRLVDPELEIRFP